VAGHYKRRSLRRTILILVSILVALALAGAILDLSLKWDVFREAGRTLEVNGYVDCLLQAAQNLAFERGRVNVLLSGAGPAAKQDLDFLAQRRLLVTENLNRALQYREASGSPVGARVRSEYKEIRALRGLVDEALAVGAGSRDPGLADRWFAAASALIHDLGSFAAVISLQRDRFTASFRSFSRMKILSLDLRDSLGVEASRIAAAASSGEVMTGAALEDVMYLRGQSAATWQTIERERGVIQDNAINAALAEVQARFFDSFRPLLDLVLTRARIGQSSPVSAARLTSASVPALDSIAGLMSVLTEVTASETGSYLASTRDELLLHASMALASLAIGILAIAVVAKRLLVPLGRLESQLKELAAGNLAAELQPFGRDDEMASACAAIVAFRDSLGERQKLQERLEILSAEDSLTGLANRRRLDEVLRAEWQRAAREGKPLALVMADVDHFKRFNDRYGHPEGDRCLCAVASVLAHGAKRSGELASRFGGEEFVVVLPGFGVEGAVEWAETARRNVEALRIPHEDVETGVVTISCGAASTVPSREIDVTEMLRRVDEALYEAKREGRNRVAVSRACRSA
jgi:diguanylate cyclase (GGDEF)-like protein